MGTIKVSSPVCIAPGGQDGSAGPGGVVDVVLGRIWVLLFRGGNGGAPEELSWRGNERFLRGGNGGAARGGNGGELPDGDGVRPERQFSWKHWNMTRRILPIDRISLAIRI